MSKNKPTIKFMIVSSVVWFAILVVIALVLCSSCNPRSYQEQSLVQSYQQVLPTVVTVQGDKIYDYDDSIGGLGTGFFVSGSHILTNDHIARNIVDGTVQVRLWNGQIIPAKKMLVDKPNDLALLEIDPNDVRFYEIPKLNLETDPQIGEGVFIIGSPFLFDGSLVSGVFARRTTTVSPDAPWRCGIYLVDTDTNPGNSGSPVFDARLGVVGIVSGFYGHFTVIIPSYSICCFLREYGIL